MDIQFEFEGQQYTAPESFYETNEFTLPDGRVICAKEWLETMPPRPTGLHVKAEAKAGQPIAGALRVWHIPQIPGKPFHVPVASPHDAKTLLRVLADYDRFQFENHIKPDYCNAQGLEVFEDGEWCEWESEDGLGVQGLK